MKRRTFLKGMGGIATSLTVQSVLGAEQPHTKNKDVKRRGMPEMQKALARSDIQVYLGLFGSDRVLTFRCRLCKADITLDHGFYKMLTDIFCA